MNIFRIQIILHVLHSMTVEQPNNMRNPNLQLGLKIQTLLLITKGAYPLLADKEASFELTTYVAHFGSEAQ